VYIDRDSSTHQNRKGGLMTRLNCNATGATTSLYVFLAEYRIKKLENVEGQMREITYFLYFRKDVNGQWKLESL
jgi:hypothetical protein